MKLKDFLSYFEDFEFEIYNKNYDYITGTYENEKEWKEFLELNGKVKVLKVTPAEITPFLSIQVDML